MQKTSAVPLRERNRLETWALVHDRASAMALEVGLGKTTVEAIAEAAGISKRTFFNYFATKEDAVLGTQPPTLPEEAVAAFRADGGEDLFGRTVRLMVAVVRSMFPAASQTDRRKELKAKYPELNRTVMLHLTASELLVESILLDQYAEGDPELARAGIPHGRDGARVLLMMASTALRFAFKRNPSAFAVGEDKAVNNAIEIFREVIKATL